MSNQKSKNVSKKIPNGTRVQTRDEHFKERKAEKKVRKNGEKRFTKSNHPDPGDNYRIAIVIDSNRKNELAVVKLTTTEKGEKIKDYDKGISRYRPYVYTKDSQGKAIKVTLKKEIKEKTARRDPVFELDSKRRNMSKRQVDQIKKDCIKKRENRKELRKLKGRKKDARN